MYSISQEVWFGVRQKKKKENILCHTCKADIAIEVCLILTLNNNVSLKFRRQSQEEPHTHTNTHINTKKTQYKCDSGFPKWPPPWRYNVQLRCEVFSQQKKKNWMWFKEDFKYRICISWLVTSGLRREIVHFFFCQTIPVRSVFSLNIM